MVRIHLLILFCFFLSGAASLIYEVLWTRQLLLVFGSTAFAVSTVLTAFMSGLALGSFFLGRIVDRARSPLLFYGLLEVGIGLYALLVPTFFSLFIPLYRLFWEQVSSAFFPFSLFQFALTLLLLLPPTTLMGGTLPVLSKFYVHREGKIGLGVGLLYALNTLGAVTGVIAAGFFLIPQLGVLRTTYTAVTLNIAVGLAALAIAVVQPVLSEAEGKDRQQEGTKTPLAPRPLSTAALSRELLFAVLGTLALSGFVAMVYEVAWTRILTLVLGSSTYAFSIMLATFLVGLGLGSLLISRFADRFAMPALALARIQVGVGIAALLGVPLFEKLPYFFLVLFPSFSDFYPQLLLVKSFLAFSVIFLPTLLLGAVFPLAVRIYSHSEQKVGRLVGTAYAVNTLGTVLGAFAAGFVLLPLLGLQKALLLAVVLNFSAGLWLLLTANEGLMWTRLAGGVVLAFLIPGAWFYTPPWDPLVMSSGVYKDAPLLLRLYRSPEDVFTGITRQYQQLFYQEGTTVTVTVIEKPALGETRHLLLSIDGKVDASTASDMSTQVLSGHLPLFVHPDPETVLVIGFASGVTVGAVTQHPVKEIVTVEIEPAVMEASHFFNEMNHEPLKDPRVQVIVNDARNYLLLTEERFDVIISEPSNPWMSGPAKLFTRDFFLLGKERLRPGGIFAQWLQLYGMTAHDLKTLLRTFQSVFPYVFVFQTAETDLILLGSEEALSLDYPSVREKLALSSVVSDLQRVGVNNPFALLAGFRLGTEELKAFAGDGPSNTDDNALIEFAAPKSLYLDTIAANREEMRKVFRGITPYLKTNNDDPTIGARFLTRLAFEHLTAREWQEAQTYVFQALTTQETADAHWLLGEIHQQQGEETSARREWEKALALDPYHQAALVSLILLHHRHGDYAAARGSLQRFGPFSRGNPLIHYLSAVTHYLLGNYQRAVVEGKQSLKGWQDLQQQGGGDALFLPFRAYFFSAGLVHPGILHYYVAQGYKRMGKAEEAEAHMQDFLASLRWWREELEDRPSPDSVLMHALQFHAAAGAHSQDEREVAKLLGDLIAAPLVHFYQGTTLYFLGYYPDAVAELRAAQGQDGRAATPLTHFYLGLAYEKLGDGDRAKSHLKQFLSLASYRNHDPRVAQARAVFARLAKRP